MQWPAAGAGVGGQSPPQEKDIINYSFKITYFEEFRKNIYKKEREKKKNQPTGYKSYFCLNIKGMFVGCIKRTAGHLKKNK